MLACRSQEGEKKWPKACEETTMEPSSEYGVVHPNQIRQWRQRLLDELPDVFSDRRQKQENQGEEMTSELYRQIGQLKVELEWVKKSPNCFS